MRSPIEAALTAPDRSIEDGGQVMADIIEPPFHTRDEQALFLVPPGRSESCVDALANAKRRTAESSIIVGIVDRDTRATVIITEVRHVR